MHCSRKSVFVLSVSLVALAATSAHAQTQPSGSPDKLLLREGIDVPLKFADDLSSKTSAEGDPVALTLSEDIKVGEIIVAKEGCTALGEITNAKTSGMMGKAGELNIRFNYLKVGDQKVRLRGTKGKEGEGKVGATIVLTVLFGPIGLIKHGKNIEIKQETVLRTFVADDIWLLPAS